MASQAIQHDHIWPKVGPPIQSLHVEILASPEGAENRDLAAFDAATFKWKKEGEKRALLESAVS
jgi:hypothetical protein